MQILHARAQLADVARPSNFMQTLGVTIMRKSIVVHLMPHYKQDYRALIISPGFSTLAATQKLGQINFPSFTPHGLRVA